MVNRHLREDDSLLQELAAASVLDADDGNDMTAKVAKLTEKLGDFTCEEIQCRLDRTYLQHLIQKAEDPNDEQSDPHHAELEQDLNSLHVETPDVAAMSAIQDFKAPLLRALADRQNKKNMRAQGVLEGVCGLTLALLRR